MNLHLPTLTPVAWPALGTTSLSAMSAAAQQWRYHHAVAALEAAINQHSPL